MANHRASTLGRAWWRSMSSRLRRLTKPALFTPRCSGIELVDVHTGVVHRVSPDELLAGRVGGDYEAAVRHRASGCRPHRSRPWSMLAVRLVSASTPVRSLVEPAWSQASDGRSALGGSDLVTGV